MTPIHGLLSKTSIIELQNKTRSKTHVLKLTKLPKISNDFENFKLVVFRLKKDFNGHIFTKLKLLDHQTDNKSVFEVKLARLSEVL